MKYLRSTLMALGALLLVSMTCAAGMLALDNTHMQQRLDVSQIGCTSTGVGDVAAVMVVNGSLGCTHTKYELNKQAWASYMKTAKAPPITGDGIARGMKTAQRDPGGGKHGRDLRSLNCDLIGLHRAFSGAGDETPGISCRSS